MRPLDAAKYQEIAKELDVLVGRIEMVLDSDLAFGGHNTLIIESSGEGMTVIPTSAGLLARTVMGVPPAIQSPAYIALAFRMAMLRRDLLLPMRAGLVFHDMSPLMLHELYFLQDFILMTFNQDLDFHASVEMDSDCSGRVMKLLLTTDRTGNTYHVDVSGCSDELRSWVQVFSLFDGVRGGSVMVSA